MVLAGSPAFRGAHHRCKSAFSGSSSATRRIHEMEHDAFDCFGQICSRLVFSFWGVMFGVLWVAFFKEVLDVLAKTDID